ncbi:hypothetical protein SUGI_1123460 [Cryptomeria japonica]|nr:hypothetical protein SUGI_1123460 [Cryptomeria japonica]
MLSFDDMMRKNITNPAHLMYNGQDNNLFENFSPVDQKSGVYTPRNNVEILEFFVKRCNKTKGLSSEGNRAREFVCKLAPRLRRLERRAEIRRKNKQSSLQLNF